MSDWSWQAVSVGSFILLVLVCAIGIAWEEYDKHKHQRGWRH